LFDAVRAEFQKPQAPWRSAKSNSLINSVSPIWKASNPSLHLQRKTNRECEYEGLEASSKASRYQYFRWHDLRHTWASWQRQNGTQLDELQKLGGWLSESMVRRYAHLSSEDISQASMRIDAAFDKLNLPKST
jgi:integrase